MRQRQPVRGLGQPEHLLCETFRVVQSLAVRLIQSMIEEHIEQLRSRLEQASGLPETTKAELLELVAAVRYDAAGLTGQESEVPASAADETGQQGGIGKLMASVDELEASHPELAASINKVADTLAKMGI